MLKEPQGLKATGAEIVAELVESLPNMHMTLDLSQHTYTGCGDSHL